MTVLDANILLYAFDPSSSHHTEVRSWLEEGVLHQDRIGLTWLVLWAFVRISTNQRINRASASIEEAFAWIREVRDWPGAVMLEPGPRHAEILEQLALDAQVTGPGLTDAVLAAIAIENGATVASTDKDFARFDGLKWVNPLAAR